ncbi:MAG: type II toxin-antitoxin system VapC family toxin [Candidatus Freyarchaeota archaeon]
MKMLIDSNIFVEYSKGNPKAVKIMENILGTKELYINDVVYSEVAYIFIRTDSGKSYFELKKDKKSVINAGSNFLNKLYPLLKLTRWLEINEDIITLANNYIVRYGLLPNDALFLATCKFYGIESLVSLDEDFKEPCKEERIRLISDVKSLKEG